MESFRGDIIFFESHTNLHDKSLALSLSLFRCLYFVPTKFLPSIRQVSSGGVTGSLKSDNSPQSTGAGNRPISRAEFDSAFLMNDRKERCSVPKGGNKYANLFFIHK